MYLPLECSYILLQYYYFPRFQVKKENTTVKWLTVI